MNNENLNPTTTEKKSGATYQLRQSGIELLKVIAIFLIVFSHCANVLQLNPEPYNLGYSDYYINLGSSSSNLQIVFLNLILYLGNLGNVIFFTCSAWFLLDSRKTNYKKLFRMISDTFLISIIGLVVVLIFKGFDSISLGTIIKCIFPTWFQLQWYVGTYVIFCLFCPLINKIIKSVSQRQHLIIALTMLVAYSIIGLIYQIPTQSNLLTFITIYFVVNYFKLYCNHFCDNKKANIIIFAIAIICILAGFLATNYLGLKIDKLSDKLQHCNKNWSVFNLMIAFSLLNLFRRCTFKSKFINYLSSLSLIIYLVHQNYVYLIYGRTYIWQMIYEHLGYSKIALWVTLDAIVLFVGSLIVAAIYKETLQKLCHFISDKLYDFFKNIYLNIVDKILKKIN